MLNLNEGPPPPAGFLKRVLAEMDPGYINRYVGTEALEKDIAASAGVSADRVIVTSGGDDAIERVMRAVLAPGREVIVPVPTYEMVNIFAGLIGCRVTRPVWLDGAFPVKKVLSAVSGKTSLIVVISPSNPTGLTVSAEELKRLSVGAPEALIMVDLAYADFADKDLAKTVLGLPNAVAVRTLSKAYGLAGLRVGYAIGPAGVISWLRKIGMPYPVSSASLALAADRLKDEDGDVKRYIARIKEERIKLRALLQANGIKSVPSQGSFILAEFKNAVWAWEALAGLGVCVRIFPEQKGLENRLRISLPGDENGFKRLCRAFEIILSPQALLFDIDNTLIDTSRSYTKAIVRTAALFGADIKERDVAAAKAKGGASNDWELTCRLVRGKGIKADLKSVTGLFEMLYQGTKNKPGFKEAERLIINKGILKTLSRRYKLGLVTGRPRGDTEAFLKRFGLTGLFGAVVTMDDAKGKPDPAPVVLCMKRLGCSKAWLFGDSSDDMQAARRAGVLPVGVHGSAKFRKDTELALYGAGASRVLTDINKLEEILP
jgi:histidinol-phosphate aminotransferase